MSTGNLFYSYTHNVTTPTQEELSIAAQSHPYSLIFDKARHTIGCYDTGFTEYGVPVKEYSKTNYINLTTKDANTLYVITS